MKRKRTVRMVELTIETEDNVVVRGGGRRATRMWCLDCLVGAETFAAVDPANNNKLKLDLSRLAARSERHRYVFFMSPCFPGSKRLPQFDQGDIQVWSIDL